MLNGSVMLAYEELGPSEFADARVHHRILAPDDAVNDLTAFVQLRGDLLWDDHRRPIDANFLGRFPTGNMAEGGTFWSWFMR